MKLAACDRDILEDQHTTAASWKEFCCGVHQRNLRHGVESSTRNCLASVVNLNMLYVVTPCQVGRVTLAFFGSCYSTTNNDKYNNYSHKDGRKNLQN